MTRYRIDAGASVHCSNEGNRDFRGNVETMTSERTLQSIVDSLGEHGKKTALLVLTKKDRERWSFEELAACARSFANGLVRDGFKQGESVALFAENSPESIAAALGIVRAGMVAVPLDVQ